MYKTDKFVSKKEEASAHASTRSTHENLDNKSMRISMNNKESDHSLKNFKSNALEREEQSILNESEDEDDTGSYIGDGIEDYERFLADDEHSNIVSDSEDGPELIGSFIPDEK